MEMIRRHGLSLLGLAMLGVAFSGCGLSPYERYELGVPYRPQDQFNYCVPASVLMWRLYDGLPSVSQASIFNWIGGPPCYPDDVPVAVNHFTNTFDTYLDIVDNPSGLDVEQLVARQITAEDQGTPVIAIVGPQRNHVGVINGGKYKKQGQYYVWEFLFFHDPADGEGLEYSSSHWLQFFCDGGFPFCGQILSSAATTGWQNYHAYYKNWIMLYGGGGVCLPRDCGPYEI
jgi:hypothetical protein